MAQANEMRGDYPSALDWVSQGLDALTNEDEGLEDTAESTELLLVAGLIHSRRGEYEDAMAFCKQGAVIAERLEEAAALARAHNLQGHIDRLQGQSAVAIQRFEEALDTYRLIGDLGGQATTHNQIANGYFSLGRWKEATKHYRRAREVFKQIGDRYLCVVTDNNLGGIALNQGRLEAALGYFQNGISELQVIGGSPWVLGVFHMNLAAAFLRKEEVEVALEHLRISETHFQKAEAQDFLPELYRHFGFAALQQGKLEEAEMHGRQALEIAREMRMRGEEGCSLHLLGEVAAARGEARIAEEYLTDSIRVLDQTGDTYQRARSEAALAQLYALQGRIDQGAEILAICIPSFEALGAELDLAAARQLQDTFN